jgi:hypothetical protein
MQRQWLPIELGLELVLDIRGADEHTAKIAWCAAALASPDSLEDHPAQRSH